MVSSKTGRSFKVSDGIRFHLVRILSLQKKPKNPSAPSPPSPEPQQITVGYAEFKQVFRYFDEDSDGVISPAELCSCMRSFGEELSPTEAEALVELSDGDGDGKLGYDDFVRLVNAEEEEERGRSLREAFSAYEMEGNGGCITAGSLRRALRRLGEENSMEQCRDMIRKFDLNGDGVICFEEFKLMML